MLNDVFKIHFEKEPCKPSTSIANKFDMKNLPMKSVKYDDRSGKGTMMHGGASRKFIFFRFLLLLV